MYIFLTIWIEVFSNGYEPYMYILFELKEISPTILSPGTTLLILPDRDGRNAQER